MEVFCGRTPLWLRIWAEGGGGRVSKEELDEKGLVLTEDRSAPTWFRRASAEGCNAILQNSHNCLCLKENDGPEVGENEIKVSWKEDNFSWNKIVYLHFPHGIA